ncbi:MAG: hypothetical protein LYZ66_06140 [Nitrososphaerales archaeon]|nr:hypothetical protein [Nitrososphaerales archaeon]
MKSQRRAAVVQSPSVPLTEEEISEARASQTEIRGRKAKKFKSASDAIDWLNSD